MVKYMLIRVVPSLCLLFLPLKAEASIPWLAYGQTRLEANSLSDNPKTNFAGVLGETELPYIVTPGCSLIIKSYGVEGYNVNGMIGLFPWLGTGPATNDMSLPTVASHAGTSENIGLQMQLPPRTQINVRLMNAQYQSHVISWYISGELVDSDENNPGTCMIEYDVIK